MIHRESEDATEANRILNDPSVFPLISLPGQDKIDATAFIADPRNVVIMADGGVIAFMPDPEPGSGIYEVHTNFLEQRRGAHAIKASVEAYRWMFTHTNCMMLQTRVPAFNKAAEAFCQMVGAWLWFERKAAWPTADGPVDLKFFAMSIHDWMRRWPAQLIGSGIAFHARLEQEYERHGFVHDPHPDEEAHDLAVGACVEMIYGGEAEKGIILYNRWARFAGYGQINLISRNPLVIDIGESILQVLVPEQTFKVIQCRSPPLSEQ
jgi:hypothetical protein